MNILVIGGSGYVGYHLVKALKSCGHRISVVDTVQVPSLLDYTISFYKGDSGNIGLMGDVLRKEHIEMVVCAGGFSRIDEAVATPMKYYSNNVVGGIFLLNTLLDHNVKKIIYISSASVFGAQDKLPITDYTTKAPINPLGYSQLFFEGMLESYRLTHGISYAIMRASNLAGLSTSEHKHFIENLGVGLIPSIIEFALGKREKIDIYGTSYPTIDGTASRDYLHVDDFCDACLRVMPHLEVRREKQIFNVGLGKAISVKEVIGCAQEIIGKTIEIEDFPEREGDADRLYFDAFRTRTTLDWRPKYETLKDIILSIWKNFELNAEKA
ncbi:MAG: NAD-dependent epimerase/dehydratase family protein [Puniceicoccales bacterium]|jgi:UDP-glucose 4-epimerase|nr:NAD-dependent epimerase/dehydratase family protein [Puniceicoccales bacterium]